MKWIYLIIVILGVAATMGVLTIADREIRDYVQTRQTAPANKPAVG